MSSVTLAGARPWTVKVPQVVRYMDRQWIQRFFETGELMLTTYAHCRSHEDTSRRDSEEGVAQFNLEHQTTSVSGRTRIGSTSYMLCGSLVESEKIRRKFSTDACFFINDPIQFADTIARWLPGFTEGKIGPCIYRDERRIQRRVSSPVMPDLPFSFDNQDGQPSQEELKNTMDKFESDFSRNISNALDHDAFFCKDASFAEEAEFRFVWSLAENVDAPKVITCPEALRFCSTTVAIDHPYQARRPQGDSGFFVAGSSSPHEQP